MYTCQYKGFQTGWSNGVVLKGMAAFQRCTLIEVSIVYLFQILALVIWRFSIQPNSQINHHCTKQCPPLSTHLSSFHNLSFPISDHHQLLSSKCEY